MPQDVPLGAGYVGDALFTRFPGQYRDPEMDSQQQAHFDSFPGNHGPVFTDPDVGRKMVLKDVPGLGQVVVPVEHTMAAVVPVDHTIAAVYPSDHTMVGLNDDPRTDQGKLKWHHTLVLALDQSANMTNSSQQLAVAFNDVAQKVIQRALHKAQAGKFGNVAAAVAFVRDAITASAGNFKPQVQRVAVQIAASASKAAESALGKVWRAPGKGVKAPRRHKTQGAVSDWPGSMMAGVTESIINLSAGSELDQLASSISKLLDATTTAFNTLGDLKAQEAAAQAIAPEVGPPAPDDQLYVQYAQAMAAVKQGYTNLTGFDYLSTVLLRVFTPNADKLRSVYSGLDGLIQQLQNWDATWQNQIGNQNPDQVAIWDQIQNAHNQLYGATTGGKAQNIDDPAYLQTASQAVQQVTGVSQDQAGMSGMGDFGISAIIIAISICIAVVAVSIAVVKLAGQFNAVANNIAGQRKQYETTMAKRHDDYIAQRVSEGTPIQDAETEWLDIKAKSDVQQTQQEKNVSDASPKLGDITKYLGYAAAAVGAVIALPHILKLVGL